MWGSENIMTSVDMQLPARTWRRIFWTTGGITAASVAMSLILANLFMETFSAGLNTPGMMISILLPMMLGAPMTGLLKLRQEQLRHANAQLVRLASTDALTGILNRGAFTSAVERHLQARNDKGAFLVIDADHFKSINDRFGHDMGDDALRMIARTIEDSIGPADLLGRLGGEEFGVYIPNAGVEAAGQIANLIRERIADITLQADGLRQGLSVSIGGATHIGASAFRDLFRSADDRLYSAKQAGRNQITLNEAA